MITYEKINSEYSNIFYNGSKVGHIENHRIGGGYWIEINYKRYWLKKELYKADNLRIIINHFTWLNRWEIYSHEILKKRGFTIKG